MLLDYGYTVVDLAWHLDEAQPTGYSRIYCVYEADIAYQDAFVKLAFRPDTIYVLPSSMPYRSWRLSDADFRVAYLHMDFLPNIVSGLIEIPVTPGSALMRFTQAVTAAIVEGDRALIAALAEVYSTILAGYPQMRAPSGVVSRALGYISSHVSENISVAELSSLSAYHPNYFIRVFKQETGMSPHKYALHLRMLKAATLLRAGERIGDVAAQLGFQDASSFARAFKARYGLSPGRFIRDAAILP